MNREEIKVMFAALSRVYPPNLMPAIDSDTINVWTDLLQDMDGKSVLLATKAWAQTNKYPPTIADIREKLTKVPAEELTPEKAWSMVCHAIRHFGPYEPQLAADYLGEIWKLIGMDWRYYNTMLEEQMPNEKSRFIKMYVAYAHREKYTAQIAAPIRQALESGRPLIGDGT